ncbi:hypothetical protein GWI34_27915 [Actinomadura sp. DSM 109109]|nr:hypothetical protein [Actinomadura lepetitiana]
MVNISFVDSSRQVERPEHGRAVEAVVCDHCGRSVEFTVFSAGRTQRVRRIWSAALILLLTLGVVALVFIVDLFVWPGLTGALPIWASSSVIVAGLLSMWVAGFAFFFWSDEFGVRSLHRWRFTGQMVVSGDLRRGEFVATCPGTWEREGPPNPEV